MNCKNKRRKSGKHNPHKRTHHQKLWFKAKTKAIFIKTHLRLIWEWTACFWPNDIISVRLLKSRTEKLSKCTKALKTDFRNLWERQNTNLIQSGIKFKSSLQPQSSTPSRAFPKATVTLSLFMAQNRPKSSKLWPQWLKVWNNGSSKKSKSTTNQAKFTLCI